MSGGVFEIVWNAEKWHAFVKQVQERISPSEIDKILAGVAWKGQRAFALAMPRRTGATARSWSARQKAPGTWEVFTMSKVALFLEEGTKAHGPVTAKFLYIPLRPGAATWRKGFVFGKDYILVKKVKGINAMHFLKPVSNEILDTMVKDFFKYITEYN